MQWCAAHQQNDQGMKYSIADILFLTLWCALAAVMARHFGWQWWIPAAIICGAQLMQPRPLA